MRWAWTRGERERLGCAGEGTGCGCAGEGTGCAGDTFWLMRDGVEWSGFDEITNVCTYALISIAKYIRKQTLLLEASSVYLFSLFVLLLLVSHNDIAWPTPS